MPLRRLEDRIRNLCQQAISAENNESALLIFEELRNALHQHATRLRAVARGRLTVGLPVSERRQKDQAAAAGSNGAGSDLAS